MPWCCNCAAKQLFNVCFADWKNVEWRISFVRAVLHYRIRESALQQNGETSDTSCRLESVKSITPPCASLPKLFQGLHERPITATQETFQQGMSTEELNLKHQFIELGFKMICFNVQDNAGDKQTDWLLTKKSSEVWTVPTKA